MQGYLIAFAGKPMPQFLDSLVKLAAGEGVPIRGAIVTEGPGCYNIAFMLDNENDRFANALINALPMAKGERCNDPRLKEGEFIDEVPR